MTIPLAHLALIFGPPEGSPRQETEAGYLLLAAFAAVQLLALLALAVPSGREALRRLVGEAPVRRSELLGLGLLTLAALLLRTLLAEPAALLSTFNDVKHAHDAMCLVGQAGACELAPAYPWALSVLHGLVFRIVGPSLEAMFWTNAALSTLTVPLAWLLGLALTDGQRRAGWFLAAALAGLPLAIRFAATGALATGFGFFATLSLLGLLAFARSGRARLLWFTALAAALAAQSRYEGPVLYLVLLAATLFVAPGFWSLFRRPRLRRHLVGVALLTAATVAAPVLSYVREQEGGVVGASLPVPLRVGLTAGIPLVLWLLARRLDGRQTGRRLLLPLGILAVLIFVFGPAAEQLRVAHLVDPSPWPAFQHEGLLLPSFAERRWALLNPRAVPVTLLLLAAVGAAVALVRRHRGPALLFVTWAGVVTALLVQKRTGELPFEYLRTAASLAVPVAGLAAWGGLALVDLVQERWRTRWRTGAAWLVGAVLLASPLLSLPMLRAGDYNNARQIAFLSERLASLPSLAVVVHPDFTPEGEREITKLFRIPELWWTLARIERPTRDDRFLGATKALADPSALLAQRAKGRRLLFWEGLACRRTGDETRRPDCARMHERFALKPATEPLTIPNRPFESDFWPTMLIRGDTVTLHVWEIVGLAEPTTR